MVNVTHFYLSAVVGCRTGIGIVCASYCNEVMLLIYREIYWRKMNVSHKQNRRGSVSLEQISMHNERPTPNTSDHSDAVAFSTYHPSNMLFRLCYFVGGKH